MSDCRSRGSRRALRPCLLILVGLAQCTQSAAISVFPAASARAKTPIVLAASTSNPAQGEAEEAQDGLLKELIRVSKLKDVEAARRLFAQLAEPDLPEGHTWMILTLARGGRRNEAENLFKKMLQQGIPASAATYGAVARAAALEGDLPGAESWFHQMREAGVLPEKDIFTSLMLAASRSNQPDKASQWFGIMCRWGIRPLAKQFGVLLNTAAKRGDLATAQRWIHVMLDAEIEPDGVSYAHLLAASIAAKDDVAFRRWYKELSLRGFGFHPECVRYILQNFIERDEPDLAEDYLLAAEEAGGEMKNGHYGDVIESYGKAGAPGKAVQIFKGMMNSTITPDKTTLRKLRLAIGNSIFDRLMVEVGLRPGTKAKD